MSHRILAVLGGLCMAGAATASDCEFRAERTLSLDAAAVSTLELTTGAGDLEVRGEAGLDQVMVRGVACASDAERLAAIQLQHREGDDRLRVATKFPEAGSGFGWFGSSYQYMDVVVRMPARLLLEGTDSSGDASVRGVAGVSMHDSSGDLEIEDIAGEVRITDSSGDIEVRGTGGGLRIPSDSSGDIEADDIAGTVQIDRDSSGDIVLRQVGGDARVEVDSSGGIRFVDVTGSATVGTDSSGSIAATRIGRDFTVRHDGSGDIDHSEVGGTVRVPGD